MSTSLPPLTQPHDRGRGGPPGVPGDPPRSPRGWPGRRSLAALMAGTALLGGGATAGILAATGQLGGDSTTTVVQQQAATPVASARGDIGGDGRRHRRGRGLRGGVAGGGEHHVGGRERVVAGPFGQGAPSEGTATGSGFVADAEGHIVTAAHVVNGASKITIRFSDGTSRVATLQGTDDATDIAVLKVNPAGLTLHPLELGELRVAEGGRRDRGDRQPVRVRVEPLHRHRLRPRPHDPGAQRLHRGARNPDGRRAQPGQLRRRRSSTREGRVDRRGRPDRHRRDRAERRRRLRRPDRPGGRRDRPSSPPARRWRTPTSASRPATPPGRPAPRSAT